MSKLDVDKKFCRKYTIPITNGDMFKAAFPNAYTGLSMRDNEVYIMCNDKRICKFSLDWWNAPYKEESEKKSE